jgi:hypothetical protein
MQSYTKKDIEFNAEGVTLRGWLYHPTSKNQQFPLIVMAHGYNCIKELYLDKYADRFANAGMAVLVYDNRNFGDSDGQPRQELDPWQQVRDYRHAITFAQQLTEINPNQIGIWGSSYSGGHVLVVGAIDKRVKCVVSQVPTISGYQTMLRRNRPDQWNELRKKFDADRKARFENKPATLVPMITTSSTDTASHASRDALDFFTGANVPQSDKWRFEKWRNEITLRSIEMYSEYEPGNYIAKISPTPLLMIVGDNDCVSLTDLELDAYNRASEPKKLVLIKGGHFAPYKEQFDVAANAACEWYIQHL